MVELFLVMTHSTRNQHNTACPRDKKCSPIVFILWKSVPSIKAQTLFESDQRLSTSVEALSKLAHHYSFKRAHP